MILRMMAAPLMVANMVAVAAFTAGSVAGAAGVVGLCALRKRMKERQGSGPAADYPGTSVPDPLATELG